jgi:hypothetical protein
LGVDQATFQEIARVVFFRQIVNVMHNYAYFVVLPRSFL